MIFANLVGHQRPKAQLSRALARSTVHTGYLFSGPPGVGKHLAAAEFVRAWLCSETGKEPCGHCPSCRLAGGSAHPDRFVVTPEDKKKSIGVDQVREFGAWIAQSPALGRHKAAIIDPAGSLTMPAANALLKTLEEPPPGTCLILCAEDEDALAPTVRSRCARLRIGRVRDADIEAVLEERGLADAGRAAAIARIAGGRPGRAIALATAPEAALTRERIVRELLDLADDGPAERLTAARGLFTAADEMDAALQRALARETDTVARSDARAASATPPTSGPPRPDEPDAEPAAGAGAEAGEGRASPAARRRGVLALASTWRELARDVAVAGLGGRAELRDMTLLEEVTDCAGRIDRAEIERFLALLDRSTASVEQNANPELVLDVLLLSWPRGRPPTAPPA